MDVRRFARSTTLQRENEYEWCKRKHRTETRKRVERKAEVNGRRQFRKEHHVGQGERRVDLAVPDRQFTAEIRLASFSIGQITGEQRNDQLVRTEALESIRLQRSFVGHRVFIRV